MVLVLVGYFFGYAYNRIDGYMAKASLVMFGLLCVVAAYMALRRYLRANLGEQ